MDSLTFATPMSGDTTQPPILGETQLSLIKFEDPFPEDMSAEDLQLAGTTSPADLSAIVKTSAETMQKILSSNSNCGYGKAPRKRRVKRPSPVNTDSYEFKDLKTSSGLKSHVPTHTGQKPFVCSTCNKAFRQKGQLNKHERIHTGEKPFVCPTCKKAFNDRGTLQKHERIHTGENPFACSTCKKAFNRKGNLQRHEMIHTGGRPFVCLTCREAFRQASTLRIHELIHTGQKPFACPTCKSEFRHKSTLQKHERTHTGEKPYSCPYFKCKKTFTGKQSKNNHIKICPHRPDAAATADAGVGANPGERTESKKESGT